MFNTTQRLSWLSSLLTVAFLGLMTLLSGCGGGGASSTQATPLTVDPGTATIYHGYPTTFTITGGRKNYMVFSSNSAILPLASSNVADNTFVVSVERVDIDTPVTLTVRDADGASATASITVKPASLNDTLTITSPITSGTQGQASVTAKTLTGAPLPGHQVRFNVMDQGPAWQFVCNDVSLIDCTTTTDATGRVIAVTTTTDVNGDAFAVIKADVGAATQFATISATDLVTGHILRKQFAISGRELMVTPTSSTWTITRKDLDTGIPETSPPTGVSKTCSALPAGPTYTVYSIFGGTPPYTVSSSSPLVGSVFLPPAPAFIPTNPVAGPITVANDGGSFIVIWPNPSGGLASGDASIVVVDSVGAMPATQTTFTITYNNSCT